MLCVNTWKLATEVTQGRIKGSKSEMREPVASTQSNYSNSFKGF